MELIIGRGMLVKDLQKQFSAHYPNLKLEFFRLPLPAGKPSKTNKINPDESVSRIAQLDGRNEVNIEKERTVGELEKDLYNKFGLFAQVFRRSGNLWIETTLTDNWTLEKQNREGAFFNHIDKLSLDQPGDQPDVE